MDDNYIPGIYNYCDRWCERCAFTSRCRNYLPLDEEDTHEMTSEEREAHYKKIWTALEERFKDLDEQIEEKMEEWGIDWEEVKGDMEAMDMEEVERPFKQAEKHPIAQLAKRYGFQLIDIAEQKDGFLKKIEDEIAEKDLLNMASAQKDKRVMLVGEALEVIQFYFFFISAKLVRALSGKFSDETVDEECNFPKDSDGSAKIALIAMERSFASWHVLLKAYPAYEREIVPFIAKLKYLISKTDTLFPEARSFMRPGFDEPQYGGGLN